MALSGRIEKPEDVVVPSSVRGMKGYICAPTATHFTNIATTMAAHNRTASMALDTFAAASRMKTSSCLVSYTRGVALSRDRKFKVCDARGQEMEYIASKKRIDIGKDYRWCYTIMVADPARIGAITRSIRETGLTDSYNKMGARMWSSDKSIRQGVVTILSYNDPMAYSVKGYPTQITASNSDGDALIFFAINQPPIMPEAAKREATPPLVTPASGIRQAALSQASRLAAWMCTTPLVGMGIMSRAISSGNEKAVSDYVESIAAMDSGSTLASLAWIKEICDDLVSMRLIPWFARLFSASSMGMDKSCVGCIIQSSNDAPSPVNTVKRVFGAIVESPMAALYDIDEEPVVDVFEDSGLIDYDPDDMMGFVLSAVAGEEDIEDPADFILTPAALGIEKDEVLEDLMKEMGIEVAMAEAEVVVQDDNIRLIAKAHSSVEYRELPWVLPVSMGAFLCDLVAREAVAMSMRRSGLYGSGACMVACADIFTALAPEDLQAMRGLSDHAMLLVDMVMAGPFPDRISQARREAARLANEAGLVELRAVRGLAKFEAITLVEAVKRSCLVRADKRALAAHLLEVAVGDQPATLFLMGPAALSSISNK
jgi:hypothetical protein